MTVVIKPTNCRALQSQMWVSRLLSLIKEINMKLWINISDQTWSILLSAGLDFFLNVWVWWFFLFILLLLLHHLFFFHLCHSVHLFIFFFLFWFVALKIRRMKIRQDREKEKATTEPSETGSMPMPRWLMPRLSTFLAWKQKWCCILISCFPKSPISSGCVIAAYFKYHCSVSR